jgi:hypothetical protein
MRNQNFIDIDDRLLRLDEILEFYKIDSADKHDKFNICVRFKGTDTISCIVYQSEDRRNKAFLKIKTLINKTDCTMEMQKRIDNFMLPKCPPVK